MTNYKKISDRLRKEGKTEFREGEDLEAWIKRMISYYPDPWANVQKFHDEVKRRSTDRKLQAWVDDHKFAIGGKQ